MAINALVVDTDASTVGAIVKLGLLDSALQAPFAGFGDIDIYPRDWQRFGVLCSRIVLNHPFLDGNRRTGLIAMLTLASLNGLELDLPVSEETDTMVLALAAGEIDEKAFCDWIRPYRRTEAAQPIR